jgi:hypothetical protein
MGWLRPLFVLYVAANMLACAVVFWPWALPRETVSGLLGRYAESNAVARYAAAVVDLLYWWHPDHCRDIARIEAEARRTLYP